MSELVVARPGQALRASGQESLQRFLDYKLGGATSDVVHKALDLGRVGWSGGHSAAVVAPAEEKPLSEQIYAALQSVKVLTAGVAMHLKSDWRHRLFKQLDSLHDEDEWVEGEQPVELESFRTFLRTILELRPNVRPGLGMSKDGHVVAAWTRANDRLTLEFLPSDKIKWVLSLRTEEGVERAAGDSTASRIASVLAPYMPNRWFGADEGH